MIVGTKSSITYLTKHPRTHVPGHVELQLVLREELFVTPRATVLVRVGFVFQHVFLVPVSPTVLDAADVTFPRLLLMNRFHVTVSMLFLEELFVTYSARIVPLVVVGLHVHFVRTLRQDFAADWTNSLVDLPCRLVPANLFSMYFSMS